MAGWTSAWGIDIGQAGLKAIRLRAGAEGEKVRAVAFDYIPHAKILSQPDAVPAELIETAMETFLARNNLEGSAVCISVPGQTSLAKFIKLPPVEAGKVAEIVKYEARQQIPFDLDEVIWDYQPLGGGVEEGGFMLDAEVGLFAMKRDLVQKSLDPFSAHGVEVELIQTSPLAIYNYLTYDVLGLQVDPDDGPATGDYVTILDMGADNTTLIVSNGQHIWIRNVPFGGNHFTRALTRDMKLTFAKAEHLKCNATKSPDPKAVFQAMRPVFNDFVSEIQRSIGYFSSVKRDAEIKRVIGVGNGFKLAGLQKFLQQNLQNEVERLETFHRVKGESVLNDPLFVDNIMAFAVPYGLALQGLSLGRIKTSLLPPEITVERTIRRKKPWAVVASAGLLAVATISMIFGAMGASSVAEDKWKPGEDEVSRVNTEATSNQTEYDAQEGAHQKIVKEIDLLVAPLERRELWMEVYKAINESLPQPQGDELDETDPTKQEKIRLTEVSAKKVKDTKPWFEEITKEQAAKEDLEAAGITEAPSGAGYIFTVRGFHFHNAKEWLEGENLEYKRTSGHYVKSHFLDNLAKWQIESGNGSIVDVGRIGISHPVLLWKDDMPQQYDPSMRSGGSVGGAGGYDFGSGMGDDYGDDYGDEEYYPDGADTMGAGAMGRAAMGSMGAMGTLGSKGSMGRGAMGSGSGLSDLSALDEEKDETMIIQRTDFVVQFVWKPTLKDERKDQPPGTSASTDGGT